MARVLLAIACAVTLAVPAWAQSPSPVDPVNLLLLRLEAAVRAGDRQAHAALYASSVPDNQVEGFASRLFTAGVVRAVVQERDRAPLEGAPIGDGYRLVVELFAETAGRARIATVSLNVRRPAGGAPDSWRIAGGEGLTTVEGLYRLHVSTTTQLAAHDLLISTEDFQLSLPAGSVFPIDSDDGVTGLVVIGRGEMRFSPAPAAEKGQVRIFSGADTVTTAFDSAYVRIHPSDYETSVTSDRLSPMPVDPRLQRRAEEIFQREGPKSFSLDISDLSADNWYLLPPQSDFLAEVQTRRWGTLTFARTGAQAEDITLFSRQRERTISLYPSTAKLAAQGRFFTDDSLLEYDILDANVEAQVVPDRHFIQGRARLLLRIRAGGTSTLTLRLAEPLEVSSVVSLEFGRLLHLRVRSQNTIIVNLPTTLVQDTDVTLVITYSGILPPQDLENEAVQVPMQVPDTLPTVVTEPNYLLSSRSYWYPQNAIGDYSTATIRITVPQGFGCVASGQSAGAGTEVTLLDLIHVPDGQVFVFHANEPLRYLAFVVSRFRRVAESTVELAAPDGRPRRDRARTSVALAVDANPQLQKQGRDLLKPVESIMRFYGSLMGDVPYASLTVALVESALPGGHSPGYFAVINSPVANSTANWREDPAAFTGFPEFFLAHELAHQWWGQGVGWKNYHDQWLSEGFAQYFAALYAQRTRGPETFGNMVQQFRRWTLSDSDEGPVSLGYRLGHIKNDSRIFRALVYNKGAGVLHMLRRWLGDEVFFNAVRRFYDEQKFKKAGTDDLRLAFEAESGTSLERFFERWIYNAELPSIRYSARVEGADIVVRFEQLSDAIFDLPVTVTITYANGRTQEIVVPITDKRVEHRFRAEAPVRQIRVNRDNAALATFIES